MTKKLILLLLMANLFAHGQFYEFMLDKASKNKYADFMFFPDSSTQSHLFTFSAQYQYATNYTAFRTGGSQLSWGINLARFATDKIILGLCLDLKLLKGGTQQYIPKEFSDDFNNNFIPTYSDHNDSLSRYTLKNAINHDRMNFGGNYVTNIGIMFSLFPQRFGGFLFTAKRGSRRYSVAGAGINDKNGDTVHPDFYFPTNYSFELSFKPYAFFKNSFVNIYEPGWSVFFKAITITAYYERLDLKKAKFYGTDISKIVNQQFINKYSTLESYGFKIGYAFY